MRLSADYVVVGSGPTGAAIGRILSDAGREVLVVERRSHVGGNVHDHVHQSGIRIHTYGPHYFRTSSDRIWEFVNRFGAFFKYEAALKTKVDGELHNWPIAASYMRRHIGEDWEPAFRGKPNDFEEAALSLMPRQVYEKFIKEYNEKQWGVPAKSLSKDLCKRFDVREDDEPRLKPKHCYQGIPKDGYAELMRNMLEGIPVMLNTAFDRTEEAFNARKLLVFTAPIDAFFGYDLGKLAYRGQQRTHAYYPDEGYVQPCGQVNTPQHVDGPQIRTLEWKHMMAPEFAERIRGTVVTTEVPFSPEHSDAFEYPFPDQRNAALYASYRKRADALENVLICGRLGEYRYLDMDQALGRAIELAQDLLQKDSPHT